MKRMNKHVEDTKSQITNTLEALNNIGALRIMNGIEHSFEEPYELLTWKNHISGRHNTGDSFTTLNQYVSIYETGAFNAILFDGSIIRASFKFDKNILVQQSLLYWPTPLFVPEEDIDEVGIRQAINIYLNSINCESKDIRMRTPFRLDFDSDNNTESHPATHLHIQHFNCRISVKAPICFNTFLKFVMKNFYPDFEPINSLAFEPLHYSGFVNCTNPTITF